MASNLPKSGEFSEGKLWFQRKGSIVTLGLTSAAVDEVGAVQSVEFPSEGDQCKKDEVLMIIEGTQGRVEVTAPANGRVEVINEAAQAEPEVISEDPLEEGWLVKFDLDDIEDLSEYAVED